MLARFREIAEARCTGGETCLEADHVHLLISLPTNLDLLSLLNNLKTTSSRLLRQGSPPNSAVSIASLYFGPARTASSYAAGHR